LLPPYSRRRLWKYRKERVRLEAKERGAAMIQESPLEKEYNSHNRFGHNKRLGHLLLLSL